MHKPSILYLAPANSVHTHKWIGAFSQDFDITLITLHEVTLKFPNCVKVHRFRKSPLGLIYCILFMNILVAKGKIKFVHAHYASSYGFLSAFIVKGVKILSVWGSDIYDFPKRSFLHKKILQFNLKRPNYVTSTSHAMAIEAQKYIDREIEVIPFGIDTSSFYACDEKQENDKFKVGTIKTLEYKYGIDVLIDAIAFIKNFHPNEYDMLEFEVYGDGSQYIVYEKKIRTLGITEKVSLCGKVDHKLVPAILNTFDLFIALSRNESFGVSVVEAMACGVVPLVTNIGGLPEVVGDENAAFIVESEDFKAAAACIIHALHNTVDMQRKRFHSMQRVSRLYDFSENLAQMRELYEGIE
jgi:L-malate glycosyltransferase